jgi:hypothetical protein
LGKLLPTQILFSYEVPLIIQSKDYLADEVQNKLQIFTSLGTSIELTVQGQ